MTGLMITGLKNTGGSMARMSAEKVMREDPPKELADIGFASLAELEGDTIGA